MPQRIVSKPAWWIDPAFVLLFLILPIFLIIVSVGPSSLIYYKNYVNNINGYTIILGLASLSAAIIGALGAKALASGYKGPAPISPARAIRALRVLGIIALIAYAIYLGPWMVNPEVVLGFFRGGSAAAADAHGQLERLPGVTSLMQFSIVFCALLGAARLDGEFRLPKDLRIIFALLLICTFVRAMLGSERLALIEVLVALYLSGIAFQWPSTFVRSAAPFLGAMLAFTIFSAAEYFRSWQYYQNFGYDSFWSFAVIRFTGYFTTAVNNGIGGAIDYEPLYMPMWTASWFYRFPLWEALGIGPSQIRDIYTNYLGQYGNPEFNNFSAIYVPFIDYGIAGGLGFMLGVGYLSQRIFISFSRLRPFGLLLYPSWYIGVIEMVRIFYFGDSRVFPVLVAVPFVAWFIREKPRGGRKMLPGPVPPRLAALVAGAG